jgi:hypothetical protein
MELTHEEVENLINRIASGKAYLFLEDKLNFIEVLYPGNELKQRASLLYDKAYKDAIDSGLLPLEEFEKLLLARGVLSEDDQEELNKLKSKLEAQNILLSKTVKVRANQERIKRTIDSLQSKIDNLIYKKQSKLVMSAESKADEYRTQYMCWASTYYLDGPRVWPSFHDYMDDSEFNLKNKVLNTFIHLTNGINVETIRFVARSTLWRIRYNNSRKTAEQLFGNPAARYTADQLNLSYWSNFYDNVYSMMPEDRPQDVTIEDDKSLDAFMDEYYKELSNDAAARRSNSSMHKGAMSAFDAEEVIVTQSNDLYEEIEYDKPREAQKIKNRTDIKKRTRLH